MRIAGALLMMTIATAHTEAVATLPAPLVSQVAAVTTERFDWNDCSVRSQTPPQLLARGCRGEYVPVSFLLHCPGALDNLTVEVELEGFEADVRWVKWWWVSGQTYYDNKHPAWVPNLLVHDFDIVKSYHDQPCENEWQECPYDPPTLKPMSVPETGIGYTQQVWLTLRSWETIPAGEHWGKVVVTSDNSKRLEIPIKFYLWPFELQEPKIQYSVDYRGQLVPDRDPPPISSEQKTPVQFKAEHKNMLRHGITNPIIPQGAAGDLPQVLGLRLSAGVDNRKLLTQGGYQGMPGNLRWFKQWGVEKVYVYGPNESNAEDIKGLLPKWRASQDSGAGVWGFLNFTGFEDHIEDAVDIAVFGWMPGQNVAEVVRKLQARGIEAWAYGQPQTGMIEPTLYRRNNGVRLWAYGFNGSMPYAFQHVFGGGHAWDDFAEVKRNPKSIWRSHMFTYPTTTGCVDTLSYEGHAAGIVDVRYLTTLEQYADQPKVQAFLARVREEATTIDLDAMRQEAARLIMEAQR